MDGGLASSILFLVQFNSKETMGIYVGKGVQFCVFFGQIDQLRSLATCQN